MRTVWGFDYRNQDFVSASRLEMTPAAIITHEYDDIIRELRFNPWANLLSRYLLVFSLVKMTVNDTSLGQRTTQRRGVLIANHMTCSTNKQRRVLTQTF